jgi:hypothetical protein
MASTAMSCHGDGLNRNGFKKEALKK